MHGSEPLDAVAHYYAWAVVGEGEPEPVAVEGVAPNRKATTIGCPDPYFIDTPDCPCRLLPDYQEGVTGNRYNGKLVLKGEMPPLRPPKNLLDKATRRALEKQFKDERAPRHSYAGFGRRPLQPEGTTHARD